MMSSSEGLLRVEDRGAFCRRKMYSFRIAALLLIVACREIHPAPFDWFFWDELFDTFLRPILKSTDAVALLEKLGDELCLNEEVGLLKSYIDSGTISASQKFSVFVCNALTQLFFSAKLWKMILIRRHWDVTW
ncbi:hypothetical protein Y032_0015g2777 [Ancylostoma ceylanicum]|uniref:Uncharacterized protein n=1 Tax=Ancylostoma ceylanicum TaxID=53326 RepID=A0A016VAC1_9BILA|nr:hypothetical protein Y032_0015g2777 [Ancylostoma ceylanicum]